ERENPDLLTPSRRRRIANGSGNSFVEVNKFIKDFNQAKTMMQGVMSGDMNKMMKQMGINPNNLPKNMPNMNGMDMSALEDMMGGAGMPDMSQLMGGAGMPDMSQMFGGGLKGKIGEFAMKQAMKRQANKIKKAKKKRK
ncbi:TPA: signal recognition particle protein, partial [Streptococcus suis]|nr:signal recognition particle protein [Streptococcus suis]